MNGRALWRIGVLDHLRPFMAALAPYRVWCDRLVQRKSRRKVMAMKKQGQKREERTKKKKKEIQKAVFPPHIKQALDGNVPPSVPMPPFFLHSAYIDLPVELAACMYTHSSLPNMVCRKFGVIIAGSQGWPLAVWPTQLIQRRQCPR